MKDELSQFSNSTLADSAKSTTGHTPGPWEWTYFTKPDGSPTRTPEDVAESMRESALIAGGPVLWGGSVGRDEDGSSRVTFYTGNGPTSDANAEFIVRACNSHDDLLAALKDIIAGLPSRRDWLDPVIEDNARAAIAKAEGRAQC